VFRRKGKGDSAGPGSEAIDGDADDSEVTGQLSGALDADDSDPPASGAAAAGGPYDVDEAPGDEIPRIDLGSLRVPVVDGLEVRLDMDEQSGEPTQLVLADGESMMQLGVFAAPRSSGIWAEIRAEIAESLKGTGGTAAEIEGALGTELSASVPTGDPGIPFAPARFVGVDRPRWFLRGLFSGPAAIDVAAAERLEFAFRETIVVRGKEAMPIRDPLPLRLPPEAVQLAQEQLEAQTAAQAEPAAPTLEQLEPGPTITETR
jgi:hypothetical protein